MSSYLQAFASFLRAQGFRRLEDVPKLTLAKVLLHHVQLIPTRVLTTGNMVAGQKLTTFLNQPLQLQYVQGRLTIKSARSSASIRVPDVFAGQNIVHVIDTVLVPNL